MCIEQESVGDDQNGSLGLTEDKGNLWVRKGTLSPRFRFGRLRGQGPLPDPEISLIGFETMGRQTSGEFGRVREIHSEGD
jgi:hypothetical protein